MPDPRGSAACRCRGHLHDGDQQTLGACVICGCPTDAMPGSAAKFPRWADLALYVTQMVVGLLLIVFSIALKHLAATIITGLAGFAVVYAAIRYGWLARRFHDAV